jgi:hypothetical protein
MKFQGLAVVLAKQKWPRLVASERKWDMGLDAYASGELEPDGRGTGLACSLTPEYEKIASDATKVKAHYPDVRVLVFATAEEVTNYTGRHWAEELRKSLDYELIVQACFALCHVSGGQPIGGCTPCCVRLPALTYACSSASFLLSR